jgi:hypothetical protein
LWCLVIGLLCLALGGVPVVTSLRWVATAERAEGAIVDVVNEGRGTNQVDDVLRPVVQFTAAGQLSDGGVPRDGRLVEFEASETAGDPSHFRVGQRVGVLYRADNPDDARLDTWQSKWGLNGLWLLPGIFLIAMGFVLLRQKRHPNFGE